MKIFSREPRVEGRGRNTFHAPRDGSRLSTLDPRRLAFTLIEVLIAITVFSLVMAAIYSTWLMIMRASRVGQEAAAQVQRQRIAVRTIEDALTCIQSFQASMRYYSFGVTNGDAPSLSFTARLPDNFLRSGKFGDYNVRHVTFSVEPGADSEKDLVLRQNPILMDMDADEQQTPLLLARNVQSFVIECWDTNALAWDDEWDATNSIPPMVRITLALGGNSHNSGGAIPLRTVTRVVSMPSQTLPAIVQTPVPTGGQIGAGGNNQNTNQNGGFNESPININPNNPNRNTGGVGGPTLQPVVPPFQNFPGGNHQ